MKMMRHLADLPNEENFRFIGIDHDGNRIGCIVRKNSIGCFSAYEEYTGEPIFMRLAGWRKATE